MSVPDPKDLPHLLNLLDDESEQVRKQILGHLQSFGPVLKTELLKLPPSLVLPRTGALENIILRYEQDVLTKSWPVWQQAPSEIEKLEGALSVLARFLSGLKYFYKGADLGELLDELSAEYLAFATTNDSLELAKFLFEKKGFTGSQNDYYDPQNSNLVYVIHEKKGLPISLSCLYILIGARVGYRIEGYNFPGHFMAKVEHDGQSLLIDAFNGGKVLEEKAVLALSDDAAAAEEAPAKVAAVDIVRRILNNLIHAYELKGETAHQELMFNLNRSLPH